MGIKNLIKRNKYIHFCYVNILKFYFRILTVISPELNTRARYRYTYKKKLNLDNPQSFSEKLLK